MTSRVSLLKLMPFIYGHCTMAMFMLQNTWRLEVKQPDRSASFIPMMAVSELLFLGQA